MTSSSNVTGTEVADEHPVEVVDVEDAFTEVLLVVVVFATAVDVFAEEVFTEEVLVVFLVEVIVVARATSLGSGIAEAAADAARVNRTASERKCITKGNKNERTAITTVNGAKEDRTYSSI